MSSMKYLVGLLVIVAALGVMPLDQNTTKTKNSPSNVLSGKVLGKKPFGQKEKIGSFLPRGLSAKAPGKKSPPSNEASQKKVLDKAPRLGKQQKSGLGPSKLAELLAKLRAGDLGKAKQLSGLRGSAAADAKTKEQSSKQPEAPLIPVPLDPTVGKAKEYGVENEYDDQYPALWTDHDKEDEEEEEEKEEEEEDSDEEQEDEEQEEDETQEEDEQPQDTSSDVERIVVPKDLATTEPSEASLMKLPLAAALLSFAGMLAYSCTFLSKIFKRGSGEKGKAAPDFEDLESALDLTVVSPSTTATAEKAEDAEAKGKAD